MLELGKVVMTKGICKRCKDSPTFSFLVQKALSMHAEGNWGDLSDEDWEVNQQALQDGDTILSSYWMDYENKEKIWIITEGDRSVTTVLLPEEY